MSINPSDTAGWSGPRRHDEGGLGRLMNLISDLRRDVSQLQRGAALRAAGISASPEGLTVHSTLDVEGSLSATGNTTIGGDLDVTGNARLRSELQVRGEGTIRAYHPGTDLVSAYFGELGGGIGTGIGVWEPSGDVIMAAKTDANGTTHSFGVRDNAGAEVLAVRDETTRGLAAPAFTVHCGPADYTVWPGTDQGSWTTIYEGGAFVYSAKTWLIARATADASGTEGQVRLVLTYDGTDYPLHTRTDIGFGIGGLGGGADLPAAIPIGGYIYVRLQARRTSGTGKIRGAIMQAVLYGS